jgi:hypothetical protein
MRVGPFNTLTSTSQTVIKEDFIDMNQADNVNNYPNIFRNLLRAETIRNDIAASL